MVSSAQPIEALNAASTNLSSLGTDEVSRDDFLKLLIAQLQHQDPLNPVENQEFVAQLATFSSLEQQQMQTKLLEQLISSQNNNTSAQALSLIGKEASVAVSEFTLQSEREIDFTFIAPTVGIESVKIFNSRGELVRSDVVNVQRAGEMAYHFDGKNNSGQSLPAGEYSISVGDTMDEDGNITSYPTFIRGFVEGVTFVDGMPILIVDGNATPFDEVYGVYERKETQ